MTLAFNYLHKGGINFMNACLFVRLFVCLFEKLCNYYWLGLNKKIRRTDSHFKVV